MRLEGREKLGYFPLPLREAERLRIWLEFPSAAWSCVDPCVGEGTALAVISGSAAAIRYGIELDAYRAERARGVCDEVIQGDALEVQCAAESISLLYENPPYDWEIGEVANRRLEALFLEHTYRWLKPGGVLVLVVQAKRLGDCREVLARQFKEVRIFRLTEPESVKYEQVVVLAIRQSRYERERLQDADIMRARSYYSVVGTNQKQLAPLPEKPELIYQVPASGPATLVYRGLPLDIVEDLLPRSAAYRQAGRILFAMLENALGQPLTPLHGGHLALVAVCGMLDGIFGSGENRHIAAWSSVKQVDRTEEQDENGVITIREKERFTNELTLAYSNGKIAVLK